MESIGFILVSCVTVIDRGYRQSVSKHTTDTIFKDCSNGIITQKSVLETQLSLRHDLCEGTVILILHMGSG